MTAAHPARRTIIVGARGSALSVSQATQVIRALQRRWRGYDFELKTITTLGDRVSEWGRDARGIFVREIEDELLSGAIDMAVHSMKDLPSGLVKGLRLAACTQRKDPRDALISRDGDDLMALKPGALVGTSSLRRSAQLLRLRPDLKIEQLRGNLDTRIRKLADGLYDAIIVARAGLQRLGVRNDRARVIPVSLMLPACGQGVLGIETRQRDARAIRIARSINDPRAFACMACERIFLRETGGGCRLPVAVHARITGRSITLSALISRIDGSAVVSVKDTAPLQNAAKLARRLAKEALDSGGRKILAEIDNEK
jgi:hydroxymethylbilane synthase